MIDGKIIIRNEIQIIRIDETGMHEHTINIENQAKIIIDYVFKTTMEVI